MNKTLIHINIDDYPKELHQYFNYNNIYSNLIQKRNENTKNRIESFVFFD